MAQGMIPDDDERCENCGDTGAPLNDEGLCEKCYNEYMYEELKQQRLRDEEIKTAEEFRDRFKRRS